MALGGDPPDRSRRRGGRAAPRLGAGRAGLGHRRLLGRRGRPARLPPPLARPGQRPRPPGRQAVRWPTSPSPSSSSRPPSTPAWSPTWPHRGVDKPVLPGIMPVTSLTSVPRMAAMGAAVPRVDGGPARGGPTGEGGADAVRREGVAIATELCQQLLDAGVPGLHFYTLNRSSATREIYAALGACRLHRDRPRPGPRLAEVGRGAGRLPACPISSPRGPTAPSMSPTNRSSPSSRATAPASTSGRRPSWSSTPPPPSTARRWRGRRCWPARRRSTRPGNWLPDETVETFRTHLIGIKGPLTTPVGGGSARSTWPSARSSTSTSASARCAGSPACPRRCSTPSRSTWSSSGRTPRTSTPGSRPRPTRPRRPSCPPSCATRWAGRSARARASGSSPSPSSGPSG